MVLSARLMFSQATPYISNVDHALRACVRVWRFEILRADVIVYGAKGWWICVRVFPPFAFQQFRVGWSLARVACVSADVAVDRARAWD